MRGELLLALLVVLTVVLLVIGGIVVATSVQDTSCPYRMGPGPSEYGPNGEFNND